MEQRTTETCPRCGKTRYASWAAAALAARQMRRRREQRMHAYHDRRCQCFHIGASRPTTSGRTT